MSAHTASQIVSIVSVRAADQTAALAVALAVVSDALSLRSREPYARKVIQESDKNALACEFKSKNEQDLPR